MFLDRGVFYEAGRASELAFVGQFWSEHLVATDGVVSFLVKQPNMSCDPSKTASAKTYFITAYLETERVGERNE